MSLGWVNRRCTGFTLVELLVVIAIMALLASLLAPAVQGGLGRGQQARCLGNLRELVAANVLYAQDHGYYSPASDTHTSNNKRWHGARASSAEPFQSTNGFLTPYLGFTKAVRTCPAARFQQTSFEAGCGGYGYNAVGVGSRSYEQGFNHLSDRYGIVPERVLKPTHTVMFTDSAYLDKSGLTEYSFAEPYRFLTDSSPVEEYGKTTPSVHFRHDLYANVAWCDGHVSAEKLRFSQKAGGQQKNNLGWLTLDNSLFDPY